MFGEVKKTLKINSKIFTPNAQKYSPNFKTNSLIVPYYERCLCKED